MSVDDFLDCFEVLFLCDPAFGLLCFNRVG